MSPGSAEFEGHRAAMSARPHHVPRRRLSLCTWYRYTIYSVSVISRHPPVNSRQFLCADFVARRTNRWTASMRKGTSCYRERRF